MPNVCSSRARKNGIQRCAVHTLGLIQCQNCWKNLVFYDAFYAMVRIKDHILQTTNLLNVKETSIYYLFRFNLNIIFFTSFLHQDEWKALPFWEEVTIVWIEFHRTLSFFGTHKTKHFFLYLRFWLGIKSTLIRIIIIIIDRFEPN